jgi:hypothetical protein
MGDVAPTVERVKQLLFVLSLVSKIFSEEYAGCSV